MVYDRHDFIRDDFEFDCRSRSTKIKCGVEFRHLIHNVLNMLSYAVNHDKFDILS